ncbi:hypothetical protein THMIRHAS_19850 [Thiosulfatimonas sediminis]|uniref:YhdP central domain-containing protein n=1 Tax=Thiosulfatimonas sediminis TaxID=2675054 RepID=A0A6F8PWS9_9GAMM|nr:AsmA-like C-terminal region-containing protein [Thiosulfatimonas sediminis]BBP46612.1 hypothetical protein THMIRHAS_19850 [Thiosulfatimonas sediminis]
MLIKRTHLFLEIILGVFIAYLVLMRLAIIGLQSYPQQSVQFLSYISGWQVNVASVALTQTWLGAEFSLSGLQVQNTDFDFQAEQFSGDINLFSPLIPVLSFGEKLQLQQVSLRFLQSTPSAFASQEVSGLSQLNSVYRQAVNYLRSQNFTQRTWQKIAIKQMVINDFLGPQTAVQIDNLDLIKASQINLIAELGVRYHDVLDFERFNLKLNLSTNSWGGLDFGSVNLISYQPLQMQRLVKLLPPKWAAIMPSGEVLVDWQTQFQDAQLAQSVAKLNAQALSWPQDDQVLPQSVGMELNWNPRLDMNLNDVMAHFELSKVQLDNQFVETLSPVQLQLYPQQELGLSAERFNIAPFKEMLRVFVESDYLADLFNQAVKLDVTDFAMRLNWQTLEIPSLRTRFGRLAIPLTDYPGVATQNLALVKQGDLFLIEAEEPVWVLEPKVYPRPMRVTLPPRVVLNYAGQNLSVDPFTLSIDRFNLSLESFDLHEQVLSVQAKVAAPDAQVVLDYLPYSLLGDGVVAWLQDSQLSAQQPRFMFSLNALPLQAGAQNDEVASDAWLDALKISGQLREATFSFDAEWPRVAPSEMTFDFTKRVLRFNSDALRLEGVKEPLKANAVISDLSQANIALEIQGKIQTSVPQAIAYLAKTPLPQEVGLAAYTEDSQAYSGKAALEITKLWIPLFGFNDQKARVNGAVTLQDAAVRLPNLPEATGVQGKLMFTEQSLTASDVKLKMFTQPARLDIATHLKKHRLDLTLQGKESLYSQAYSTLPVPFRVTFSVPMDKQTDEIAFYGQMHVEQAVSTLPYPFSAPQLTVPLTFSGRIGEEEISVDLVQTDLAEANLKYSLQENRFTRLQSYLGQQANGELRWGGADSFVRGEFDRIEMADWIQWWESLPDSTENQLMSAIRWQDSRIVIGRLNYRNQMIDKVALTLNSLDAGTKLGVTSDQLVATALIPQEGVIDLNFERIRLKSAQSKDAPERVLCAIKNQRVDYPQINVLARNVQFDDYPFDEVRFSLQPNASGYATEDVYAEFSEGVGKITAKYRYDQNRNLSAAEIDVDSKKLEKLMKYLGISKGVTSKRAKVHSEIAWFGGFECFAPDSLFGRLNFKLDEGVVESVEPGLARLLGLLSVDSLARRLQLKLDDVTNDGLAYDEINGNAILNNNKMQLTHLKLQAPAVKVAMQGGIDIADETFDLKADVTPAIGSSLPTIAALAGVANPIAALAIYTVLKVLPDINENLVSYQYQIKGPWKEPIIELIPAPAGE